MPYSSSPKTIIRRPTSAGRRRSRNSTGIEALCSNLRATIADLKSQPIPKHTRIPSIGLESTRANIYSLNLMPKSTFRKRTTPASRKALRMRTRRMPPKQTQRQGKGFITQRQTLFPMFPRITISPSSPIEIQSIITISTTIRRILIPPMWRNQEKENPPISTSRQFKGI
jgi:hypothetical protein